jgi:hypothetical protein
MSSRRGTQERRRFLGQRLAGFDRILISADRHGKLIQPGADDDRQGSVGAKKIPAIAGRASHYLRGFADEKHQHF